VVATSVGYSGGTSEHPTYATVCAGDGHTEVVRVTYDPAVIPYERLLAVFFREHDPSYRTKPQYRSAIWYTTPSQGAIARAEVARLTAERRFGAPLATLVAPAGPYWPAEDYHQGYMAKRRAKLGR
jgi:methionine-S-sulfoxide reductase